MRATWDALASAGSDVYVGDPVRAPDELASLFGRLGAEPRGGTCLEVGCGPGRMTALLADRFDRVLALDVSPVMLERAGRATAGHENVELVLGSGARLDGVADGIVDVLVCYLVLQHLPDRSHVVSYLHEFARVLAREGEAFVQVPVHAGGVLPRAFRAVRGLVVPLGARLSSDPARSPAFRGFRLTARELRGALDAARLRVVARDEGPDAPYRYARDLFLRLRREP